MRIKPIRFPLTLLPLHSDEELLAEAGGLQVAVLVRHYGDDPLTPVAHHMLKSRVHRLSGYGIL